MTPLPLAYKYSTILVAGPTGTGKSEIAVAIAERLDGEIVGADAYQIYDGLGILTGQPGDDLRRRIPHHLIGEVPASQTLDVAQYLVLAEACLADVRSRGRVPIVVGGTGLYVRSLIRGLNQLPSSDPVLRARLVAMKLHELRSQLSELDPAAAAKIDLHNARRIVRALEVCILTGKPFSQFQKEWDSAPMAECGILLVRPRVELDFRIDGRVEAMFKNGAVAEVREALPTLGATAMQALGVADIRSFLGGEITESACISNIQRRTRQFARRQMTWFRKEKGLRTVELSETKGHWHSVITDIVDRGARGH